MKLTKQEELGILIAAELALHDGQRLSLFDIGKAHGVSLAYLKKIIRYLKAAGLVESKEGVGGGYVLTTSASEITILQILQAVGLTNKQYVVERSRTCPLLPGCLPQRIRQQIEYTFLLYCRNVTLDQILKKG